MFYITLFRVRPVAKNNGKNCDRKSKKSGKREGGRDNSERRYHLPAAIICYERHPTLKVLILAALKQEIKYLLKDLSARKSGKGTWMARHGKTEAAIVLTGMGVENAAVRAKSALMAHKPSLVISAGFAGALYEGAEYGELVCPAKAFLHPGAPFHSGPGGSAPAALELAGPRYEDFFGTVSKKAGARRGSIVTLSVWVEKPAVRSFLPAGLSFPLCDMETFKIAETVMKTDAEFFALRSITDKSDEEIGISPMEMAGAGGQISTSLAVWRFVSNPGLIPRALRFWRSSDKAARALSSALKGFILSL